MLKTDSGWSIYTKKYTGKQKDLKLRVTYLNNVMRVPSVTMKRLSLSICGGSSVLAPCDAGRHDLLLSPRCKSANSSSAIFPPKSSKKIKVTSFTFADFFWL
jgi:hypothetical protein